MAVTVDAVATAKAVISGTSTTLTTLTVGAGATSIFAWFTFGTATVSAVTATWGAQPLTVIKSQASTANGAVWLFGGVNPTTGNQTLTVSWTTTSTITLDAISFLGSVSSSVAACFTNAAGAAPAVAAATLTISGGSASGICLCGTSDNSNSVTTPLAATGSTLVFNLSTQNAGQGARATGAASVAWSTTYSAAISSAIAGCNVAPAVVAAAFPPFPTYSNIQIWDH